MPENRKLPFLDTKISLFDLQNLEKRGFLKSIFIELLKAEKKLSQCLMPRRAW